MVINRRKLITGLISFVAAPAIVRVESLMKLPKPEKVMTREEILKIMDKLWANGFYGKFVQIPNQAYFFMNDGTMKVIPDEELYI